MYFRFDNREKNQLPLQRRTEGKRGKGAGWGVGGGGGDVSQKCFSDIFNATRKPNACALCKYGCEITKGKVNLNYQCMLALAQYTDHCQASTNLRQSFAGLR